LVGLIKKSREAKYEASKIEALILLPVYWDHKWSTKTLN